MPDRAEMKPKLSVIMPVWNGEPFLAEAIQSVLRSTASIELIVIDDGSTDATPAVSKTFADSIVYLRQENAGQSVARNNGLNRATADFIAFLDADDLWAGQHPDAALSYLERHSGVDLVLGRIQLLVRRETPQMHFVPSGDPFHGFLLGAAVARRRLIEKIGGFNPDMRHGEDIDWFLRARETGAGIANLPETSLYYRQHRPQQGRDAQEYQEANRLGLLSAFRRSMQRQRNPSAASQGPPLVSVIIPVYNGERFIAAAIQSVLAQTYRPLELIVVDDGSTDRTRDIVATFPLATLLVQDHRGEGAARNAGVRAAKGDMIAFLDADDLWMPEKLVRQMEALTANPELEAVFAHLEEFRDDAGPVNGDPRPCSTAAVMLIRRAAFDRIGRFPEQANSLEAIEWRLRASEKSLRSLMLPDMLYRRRIHGENLGMQNRDLTGYVHALKASLDRRRQNNDAC